MKIQELTKGAVLILAPAGPLIAADAEQFRERAMAAAHQTLGRVVVDAAAIPYVDSRGLEMLLDVTEQLQQSGRALKVCGANQTVREILSITGLADMFEHFDDVNEAVRSFL
jgi:anti-sigma B factor antagonist